MKDDLPPTAIKNNLNIAVNQLNKIKFQPKLWISANVTRSS
jgi:hypothetical protein